MKKLKEIKTIILYLFVFICAISIINQYFDFTLLIEKNFLNWDAEHYAFIKDHGYDGFRIAFFPLFPLIWKVIPVDAIWISIINAGIFLTSIYILIKQFGIKKYEEIVLYLSIPSFIFFYLPYSESVFFLCSSIMLIGIKNKNYNLLYIGLFLTILSRPAFTVFIPALIILELFNPETDKKLRRIVSYITISLIGVLLVGLIQYIDTGLIFQFFSVQKNWGNELQIPQLPLTSWGGDFNVKLDGFAFIIGVIAGLYLLKLLFNISNKISLIPPQEVIFSIAYISGISLIVLIFRGGSLFSLNRFVFATPFIIICLNYWLNYKLNLNFKQLLLVFWLIFFFWFLFGSYHHIQVILKFLLLTIYVFSFFLLKSSKPILKNVTMGLIIASNFTIQLYLFCLFLKGEWVA